MISLVYLNLVIARVKYPRSEVTYSSRIDLNSTQLGEEGDPGSFSSPVILTTQVPPLPSFVSFDTCQTLCWLNSTH